MLRVEWRLSTKCFFTPSGLLACGPAVGPAGRRGDCCACASVPWRSPGPGWRDVPLVDGISCPYDSAVLVRVLALLRATAARIRLWTPLAGATLIAWGYATGYASATRRVFNMAGPGCVGGVVGRGRPAAAADHALVRFGDYSYGVYLPTSPILVFLFTRGRSGWCRERFAGVVAAGALRCSLAWDGRLKRHAMARCRRGLTEQTPCADTRVAAARAA